jgi:CBS domain-containing protein
MSRDAAVVSILRRPPVSVGMDDSIEAVERFLVQNGLPFAPVVDPGGTTIGVLSATDLLRFRATGRDAAAEPAWRVCTWKPVSVSPATPLDAVVRLMAERHVHHVLVGEGTRVLGVVSALDLARALAGV